jgi:predicted metal-dependent HD superfamily phosphohydrolase
MMNPFILYKNILEKYVSTQVIFKLEEAWNEPKRKYHNVDHLKQILEDLEKKRSFVTPIYREALILAAFFHDVVYLPGHRDNEDKSLQMFIRTYKGTDWFMAKKVGEMIECTKYRKRPTDPLLKIFWDADNAMFFKGDIKGLIVNEHKIRQEFNFVSKEEYKKKRIAFLKTCLGTMGPKADQGIRDLIKYIEKTYKF